MVGQLQLFGDGETPAVGDRNNNQSQNSVPNTLNSVPCTLEERLTEELQQFTFQSEGVNRFESFEHFQTYIRHTFIVGSGIDPELFEACVEFRESHEATAWGDWESPIHEALNWHYTRFGHQAQPTFYGAILRNEDGSAWQAILSIYDEKHQKNYIYRAPNENGDRAYFPPVPLYLAQKIAKRFGYTYPVENPSFWEWIALTDIPVIRTEGAKKALCLLSNNYIGLSVYGCSCGSHDKDAAGNKTTPWLIQDIKNLASPERFFLDALDADEKIKANLSVRRGKKIFREAIAREGCYYFDLRWDHFQGKGVDDFIVANGVANFDQIYGNAIAILKQNLGKERGEVCKSKSKKKLKIITDRIGEKLAFNEMSLQVEIDGSPINPNTLRADIAEWLDMDISNDLATQIITKLALKKTYHPVQDYILEAAEKYPQSEEGMRLLNSIASRYLGSTHPLHNVFLKKTLIGAIRRVFEPGCQHDTVCVLQGRQGIQKSKFWRTLAVDQNWFDDTISSAAAASDKDERMKIRDRWILELAEIEAVFRRREIASLRGFITSPADNFRPPYGRKIESFPRMSIFVGSVNPDQFLCDPEGHRRYWVVPVGVDRIDIDALREEVQILWAMAYHAWVAGEANWLNQQEDKLNELLNKVYEESDIWDEPIDFFLNEPGRTKTTVFEVASICLKIPESQIDKRVQMRITQVLKSLGWEKEKRITRTNTGRKQYWIPGQPTPDPNDPVVIMQSMSQCNSASNSGGGVDGVVSTDMSVSQNPENTYVHLSLSSSYSDVSEGVISTDMSGSNHCQIGDTAFSSQNTPNFGGNSDQENISPGISQNQEIGSVIEEQSPQIPPGTGFGDVLTPATTLISSLEDVAAKGSYNDQARNTYSPMWGMSEDDRNHIWNSLSSDAQNFYLALFHVLFPSFPVGCWVRAKDPIDAGVKHLVQVVGYCSHNQSHLNVRGQGLSGMVNAANCEKLSDQEVIKLGLSRKL